MSSVFSLGDEDIAIKYLQRSLNEQYNLDLTVDGVMGKVTQSVLARYQKDHGIEETDDSGVCYGEVTQGCALPFIREKYLVEEDYVNAAEALGVEVACVKAFAKVESREYGFLKNGYPVILFERHRYFRAISENIGPAVAITYADNYPEICSKIPGGYLGGKGEISRLKKATDLHRISGLSSTSWGMFQIMGENYEMCGYTNVEDFVADMKLSERKQMAAFVEFIKSDSVLHTALAEHDWSMVARRYNGPNYKINRYDVKMREAFEFFS